MLHRGCAPATTQRTERHGALSIISLILSSLPQTDPFPHPFFLETTMSSTSHLPATSSSPNFQLIFNTALKSYETQTNRDLITHPLASQLQACDSPASILAVLQGQVDDLDQSRKTDERLTKWLSPTVNVLLTFSATIGRGVSLVRKGPVLSFWDHNVTMAM